MARQFHHSFSLLPETTSTFNIGSDSLRWLEGFFTNLDVSTRATVPTPINATDAATKGYVDALFNPVVGTVEEADGSPAITQASTLRFDQADGFVLTNPSSGVARIDLASVPNSVLANSSVTITAGTGLSGGGAVSLGAAVTVTLSTHDHQGAGAQGGTLDAAAIAAGTLAVARGGTNLGSGTSGGILGYTATGVLASSVALTANAIVIGGGAGATPTPMTGTSGGVPYFNAATTVASSGALLANAVVLGGGAGAAPATMTDPGADRLIFWDESANAVVYLTAGSGLTITDTTITSTLGLVFAGSDTAERTTTSTTSVDLSTTTVSIATGTPFMWMAKVRKTSGAANTASFGVKLNASQVLANTAWSSGTNQNEFGILAGFFGAHDATYTGTGLAFRGDRTTGGSTLYALDGDMPNATITSFIVTAQVADPAITMAVDDVYVWTFPTS